jgi:CRISPR type I-E-associated protein CasB/Cse2
VSTVGSLVHWTLAARDNPRAARVRATLARAVTPELAQRALAHPAISARLAPVPERWRLPTLSALAVIAEHRHLRHSAEHSLGHSLSALGGSAAASLALAAGGSRENAVRLLGYAVQRAGRSGPVNLIEFTGLIAAWDDLTLRARSTFLVDFHGAARA